MHAQVWRLVVVDEFFFLQDAMELEDGLIYRMGDPKVVILVFASGKLVCTGGKSAEMVDAAVFKLHSILEEEELIYYD